MSQVSKRHRHPRKGSVSTIGWPHRVLAKSDEALLWRSVPKIFPHHLIWWKILSNEQGENQSDVNYTMRDVCGLASKLTRFFHVTFKTHLAFPPCFQTCLARHTIFVLVILHAFIQDWNTKPFLVQPSQKVSVYKIKTSLERYFNYSLKWTGLVYSV